MCNLLCDTTKNNNKSIILIIPRLFFQQKYDTLVGHNDSPLNFIFLYPVKFLFLIKGAYFFLILKKIKES